MKIMDILVKDAVLLDLASTGKQAALQELARSLAVAEPRLDAARLLEVLLERERLQSTGIGDGVAIPHGKLPGLDRLVASFARSRAGVDFDSIDGQPTHLFFLLVVPEHCRRHASEGPRAHLALLPRRLLPQGARGGRDARGRVARDRGGRRQVLTSSRRTPVGRSASAAKPRAQRAERA